MVAKLSSNFRSGNLAEGLCREVLRRCSAVAPVPHEEDVGVDLICTLLRPVGQLVHAEETFAVQVKSASDRDVRYNPEQERWFRSLNLPLFLASVDRKKQIVDIYATESAHNQFPHLLRGLVLSLDPPEKPPLQQPYRKDDDEMGAAAVWLGPPILRIRVADAEQDDFHLHAYDKLKPWLSVAIKSARLRAFGVHRTVWFGKKGEPVVIAYEAGPANMLEVLQELDPLLWRLRALLGHPFEEGPLRAELKAIADFMKRRGLKQPVCDLFGS